MACPSFNAKLSDSETVRLLMYNLIWPKCMIDTVRKTNSLNIEETICILRFLSIYDNLGHGFDHQLFFRLQALEDKAGLSEKVCLKYCLIFCIVMLLTKSLYMRW